MNIWPYDVPTDSGKLTEAELDAHNHEFHPRIPRVHVLPRLVGPYRRPPLWRRLWARLRSWAKG